MRKKLLLTFALLLTAVTGAWADDSGSCGEVSYSYVESTHTLTISGTGAMTDYPNPSERPWDSYAGEIETVIIEDGVTGIGINAFGYCASLTTVTIGSGVTYIGGDAFYYCPKAEVVYCNANPATLTWEESGCDDFKEDGSTIINVADAAPWIEKFTGKVNGTFSDTPYVPLTWNYDADTKTLTFSGTAPIPSYEYPDDRPWKDYVSEVENIVINEGVTSIGINALGYCVSLTTVTIPASVTGIGMSAFCDCTGLTTITIPASVTSIGRNAFYHCESLTSVIVYASNCTLGEDAFDKCNKLDAIYVLSDKVEYYKAAENWSAYADKITAFIGGGDCGAEGHETDVTWLLKGTSPNYTLTISGTGAMADYASSENQPWKDYRSSITSVIIESGVTSIGKNAFNNCTGLTSVTVDAPNCTLGNGALEGCSKLKAIYVPSDLVDHYKTAWSAYASIIMDVKEKIISQGYCGAEGHETDVTWVLKGTSPNYILTISGTGAMADYDSDERPWYSYAKGIETVVIESGVTSIGNRAFKECTGLTSVTIPSSVTNIGERAFLSCKNLPTVTIPASVTSIGDGAFLSCSNLATMTVEAGNKVYDSRNSCNAIIEKETNTLIAGCKGSTIPGDVTSIGNYAFYYCDGLTSVTIPSSVTSIGNYAFEGCSSLTTVTIPASVKSIGDNAFSFCTGLTTVTIGSGVTYIGYNAFYGCGNVADVYCYADPDALTWDESGCDDFKSDGSTKCHVTDADPWSDKFGGVVNVDFVDDLAPEAVTNPAGEEYWSSYYNSAAHLKADDNTTVYKASLSGTTVTLTEITDKVITAGQAVLLMKTTADPVELTPCATGSTDDYSGNDLEGVDEDTAKEPSFDYYVLSYQNSKLSFYKYSGTTLGANKAFFKISANSSREFFDILGGTTSIEGLKNGRIEELKFYDLNGRRVENPTKGIYIVNGKKVVIKN